MSEPSSRRSFLFGREPTADDQWSGFLAKLRRACRGPVKLVTPNQAYLNPLVLDDVIQAREICQQYQVVLALDGLPLPKADRLRPVLWVQAGSAWGSVIPLGETGLWRLDAGCPMSVAQAAGLLSAQWPSRMTNVAQWLAQAFEFQPLVSTGVASHLVSVDWLLPDGTIEVFGAFGSSASQPLTSLAAQKVVPKLFEYSSAPALEATLHNSRWPTRCHLDALLDPESVNLAHFFVGHRGTLGWLVAATFELTDEPLEPILLESPSYEEQSERKWAALDQMVKQTIDENGVFLSWPNQTE